MNSDENKSECFEDYEDQFNFEEKLDAYSHVKIDKNQYLNSSGLTEIDALAKEVFVLFHKFSDFISYHNINEELIDFEHEARDKMYFKLSREKDIFGTSKPKNLFCEGFEQGKGKGQSKSPDKVTANATPG